MSLDGHATLTHYNALLAAKVSAIFALATIVGSTAFSVIQSLPSYYQDRNHGTMYLIEALFIAYFTAELLLRLIFSPDKRDFLTRVTPALDLLSVLPFYIGLICGTLPFNLRILKLVRGVVILRSMHVSEGIETNVDTIVKAMVKSREVLILYMSVVAVSLIVWSSAIYYLEKVNGTWWDDNLNLLVRSRRTDNGFIAEVSPFQSIPHSLWWCIATVTTVGYGDVVPFSYGGKIIAGMTMISGIFVLALPTSILGSNFLCVYKEKFKNEDKAKVVDPEAGGDENVQMEHLVAYIENLSDSGAITRRMAEYVKRCFWCPEYRSRVQWAYRSAMLVECDTYEVKSRQARYIGYVHAQSEVRSPEVRVRHGCDLQCSSRLTPGTYISFCVGGMAGDGVREVRSVRLLPASLYGPAEVGVKDASSRLWCRLFASRSTCAAELREQELIAADLASIEESRAAHFIRLVKLITSFVEQVSASAASKPLTKLFRSSSEL
eukprot:TRINITY_DN37829_c0_g1_i1.p1 TRINITY_DN37829_c0_g1~~TRINITY_DN37829_c0_g1_i1.p1  ORF type:complete len:520 (+),score=111.44 TRINITY_DN37829_c0_g1_i1:86-1561(+)